jgi:hypothetical protein
VEKHLHALDPRARFNRRINSRMSSRLESWSDCGTRPAEGFAQFGGTLYDAFGANLETAGRVQTELDPIAQIG